MSRIQRVLSAGLVAGVLWSCSKSSTGPADPLVGTWSVTLPRFAADSSYFTPVPSNTPAPVTVTITKTPAGSYSVDYPDLVYHGVGGGAIDTYTIGNDSSSFTAVGDSIYLKVGAPIGQCTMTLVGTFSGSAGSGKYWVRFGCGPSGADTAAWSAQKQ